MNQRNGPRELIVCHNCGEPEPGRNVLNREICPSCGKPKTKKNIAGYTRRDMSLMAEKRFSEAHRKVSVGDGIYDDCVV
jgi:RNA polymerase subunit RPABC4/transcription elongation factor Spt4